MNTFIELKKRALDRGYKHQDEAYRGFQVFYKMSYPDKAFVPHISGYFAILEAWPAKGRPEDVIIEVKGIRELKKKIKDFWGIK